MADEQQDFIVSDFKTRNCGCYLSSAIAWSVPTTAAAVAEEGAES